MPYNILKKAYVTGVVVGLTFPVLSSYLGDRFSYFTCTTFRFFKGVSVGYLVYRTTNLIADEVFNNEMDELDNSDELHEDLVESCNNIVFVEGNL
jgi:hypothetical protein